MPPSSGNGGGSPRELAFGGGASSSSEENVRYPDNTVITSKYTVLTFLPLNIWEQLHKAANVYFLIISVVMAVGQYFPWIFVGTVSFGSTALALGIMMAASAVIAAIDDSRRHSADNRTNGQLAVLVHVSERRKPYITAAPWRDVAVGDVVVVRNGEMLPADILPLGSSGDEGACYVETANLDGETNLKIKTAPGPAHRALCCSRAAVASSSPPTNGASSGVTEVPSVGEPLLDQAVSRLAEVSGLVHAEAPQKSIHTFTGSLRLQTTAGGESTEVPLGPKQLMLRGTVLRNTAWCVGLVIYTGSETRMVMNSRKASPKYANLEKVINTSLVVVIGAQSLLALISAVLYVATIEDYLGFWYLFPDGKRPDIVLPDVVGYWLTYFILYSNLMPISLYFTMEVCNVAQAFYIKNDLNMYDEGQDCPANARSTNLGHELGQVSYVFSDKTGTLTQNVMELKRISVGAQVYGHMGEHRGFRGGPEFAEAQRDPAVAAGVGTFLEVLAVSHTVVASEDQRGGLNYEAESPDEGALVEAAAELGWRFVGRTSAAVSVEVSAARAGAPDLRSYRLLALNAFTSDRKRQSVVVQRQTGERVLLVKGADDKMLARASARGKEEFPHDHLLEFSKAGLRTLVLGSRSLGDAEWSSWFEAYTQAQRAMENREEKLAEVAETLEVELDILGVTAIEDKLQVGVQETIVRVREAGIKLWVLTGDKLETARNIGFSSRVLSEEMHILVLDSIPGDELVHILGALEQQARAAADSGHTVALIVTGRALEAISKCTEAAADAAAAAQQAKATAGGWRPGGRRKAGASCTAGAHKQFLALAELCRVVIACRVSPLQKAEMVRLVRHGISPTPVTLAIGDGANDVPMIQEASVGVGISGREGRQAVNAADFSIAQFRFLQRLLLVHGRWNYRRTCKFVLYSFWKNTVLVLIMFYYTFVSAYGGTSLFEDMTRAAYNFILATPIIAVGIFDCDVTAEEALALPELYEVSRLGLDLHTARLVEMLLSAFGHSLIISATMWLAYPGFATSGNGDYYTFGTATFTVLIISMNYRACFITQTWNIGVILAHVASWAFFVVFILFYCMVEPVTAFFQPWMYMVPARIVGCTLFWACALAVPAFAMAVDASKYYVVAEFFPDHDRLLRETAHRARETQAAGWSDAPGCWGAVSDMGLGAAKDTRGETHGGQLPQETSSPAPNLELLLMGLPSERDAAGGGSPAAEVPRRAHRASSFDFSHPEGAPPRTLESLGPQQAGAGNTSLVDGLELRRAGTVLVSLPSGDMSSGRGGRATTGSLAVTTDSEEDDTSGSDSSTGVGGERAENRPDGSRLAQQTLPCKQLEITGRGVTLASFVVGVLLMILGVILWTTSDSVRELRIHYAGKEPPLLGTKEEMRYVRPCEGSCEFNLTVTQDMEPPISVFYSLYPFYQNYASYVHSSSLSYGVWAELVGQELPEETRERVCPAPTRETPEGDMIFPCGTAATSLFNDSLEIVGTSSGTDIQIGSERTAWPSDVRRFDNLPGYPRASGFSWLFQRYPAIVPEALGAKTELFTSWMRPEAMSSMNKLYGHVDTAMQQGEVLTVRINSTFPMAAEGGSKQFVLTTTTHLGGRSSGFGVFLAVGGAACWLMSLIAFSIQLLCPRARGQPRERRALQADCTDSEGSEEEETGATEGSENA